MKKPILFIAFLLLSFMNGFAQMPFGNTVLYGNEWIDYQKVYYKIEITTDGIYRIPFDTLAKYGVPIQSTEAARLQIFHQGQEIPIYTSTEGIMVSADFIEFYGEKNRSAIDQFLYQNGATDLLNPEYSLYTDVAAYFLTVAAPGVPTRRYATADNDLGNLPPKEEWCWVEQVIAPGGSYQQMSFNDDVEESIFNHGEGFGINVGKNVPYRPALNLKNLFTAAVKSHFYIRLLNKSSNIHTTQINIRQNQVAQVEATGYQIKEVEFEHSLNAADTLWMLNPTGNIAIATIKIKAPKTFNFDNQSFYTFKIPASSESKYLEIENFNAGNTTPILYDLTNSIRLETIKESNKVLVKLPPSAQERSLVLHNGASGLHLVSKITPRNFQDYAPENASFLIVSSPKLRQDEQGNDWLQAYAEYRSSPAGGTHKTLLADIEQLYDQFAYGIPRHPLAIRNFFYFVKNKAQWQNLRYVFLIGDALHHQDIRASNNANNTLINTNFFVPTFGVPGSDYLLLAPNGTQIPEVPIGRLAATAPKHVKWYLDKIIEHETPRTADAERAWRKQVIHLGGGDVAAQQRTIKSHLNNMAATLQHSSFGANVNSVFKSSDQPIQVAESEVVTKLINDGASILTFFGHGGLGGFDFSIDDPSTYQNQGRYHVAFGLGCSTGNLFARPSEGLSASEKFLLQENKGAIAFLSTIGTGELNTLNRFQSQYYRLLSGPMYGKGIGDVMKGTIEQFNTDPSIYMRSLLQQFSLHGDPSVRIIDYEKPDYKVDAASVKTTPTILSAQDKEFKVQFRVLNIGKATQDSLSVQIIRELPNKTQQIALRTKIFAPRFDTELEYQLPILGEQAAGENRLFIQLDTDNEIEEQPAPEAESNNEFIDAFGVKGLRFFVFSNSVKTIYPPDFGILNAMPVTLRASNTNISAPAQGYLLEIDTTGFFNSPIKKTRRILQKGGLIEWLPDIPVFENTAYYWRVSPDSTAESGYLWANSTFTYLPQSPVGWNQSHYFQFLQNQLENIQLPDSTRRIQFSSNFKALNVLNGIIPTVAPITYIGAEVAPYQGVVKGGISIIVLDSITANPWYNPGLYGSAIWYGDEPFPFWTTTFDNRKKAIDFLNHIVPPGNYVLLHTLQQVNQSYNPQDWAADSLQLGGINLFNLLEAQGAKLIRKTATEGAKPYLLLYKKDDPSFIPKEILADSLGVIDTVLFIEGNWTSGTVRSAKVGPARSWSSLEWLATPSDAYDEVKLDLYGIRADASSVLLQPNVSQAGANLSAINPQDYPYLQLEFSATDETNRTAPQLNYWKVLYEGLPEAILSPSLHVAVLNDTIQQGEPFRFEVAIANASTYDMDSLLVKYSITDETNKGIQKVFRWRSLEKQDTIWLRLELPSDSTRNMLGHQRLVVEINLDADQPELYFFNNIGIFDFFVKKDLRNPLMDVTFDGTRIMNGDIVSAKPLITIALKDENRFLQIKDIAAFKVSILYPDEIQPRQITFDANEMQFYPADDASNTAKLEWMPHFSQSGVYELTAQGKDATGNTAGEIAYQVSFEVDTKSKISNVLNYPNPFSTATHFVYTLTGEVPPVDFKIQIMTVSGRIVRELTQVDLGPLKIGRHQTEFPWDGTDQFGDPLANGVYLYRIIAKDQEGNNFEKYDNGTDRFFKNDIGKLVILR